MGSKLYRRVFVMKLKLEVDVALLYVCKTLIPGKLILFTKCYSDVSDLYKVLSIVELPRDKTNKMPCASSEDRSAWASAMSDQSSLCAQWVMRTAKNLIRLDRCQGRSESSIKKTCLYNFDPLKPHFYIVKLGLTGVYIIFLFCSKT